MPLCRHRCLESLSREQRNVFEQAMSGGNIFFTGSAGTGKSYLLKQILGALPEKGTFVTASTGVAATIIGGTTLHSFAGFKAGSGKVPRNVGSVPRARQLAHVTSPAKSRFFLATPLQVPHRSRLPR